MHSDSTRSSTMAAARTQIQLLELATDGRPDGRPLKLLPFDMTVPDR